MGAMRSDKARERLSSFVEGLQASGRYTFRREEAEAAGGGSPVAVQASLRRLKQKGRIVSPRRGFHVIVPPEYRVAGAPPASWFIHDLMGYLEQPYYVGLLSAAAIHGAAHQQPMAFQVITNRRTRSTDVGRGRILFIRSARIHEVSVVDVRTETGTMRVSTPEATALDLVRHVAKAGDLSNVATVLSELSESIEPDRLQAIARSARAPDVQRLGFLLDLVQLSQLANPLADVLSTRPHRRVLLDPGREDTGTDIDRKFRIVPNVAVEPDL
jgi:predicted transcriptional regulator of viral defense system